MPLAFFYADRSLVVMTLLTEDHLEQFYQALKKTIRTLPIKSSYSLYYAEACNEFTGPFFAALHLQTRQLFLKKCRRSGEPLATL